LITSFSIQPYCRAKHPCLPLRDAAQYVTKLPKAEHDAEEWRAAMQALSLVAEHDGPTIFARIGIMRALNRGYVREFNTSRKDTHWGQRKLIWLFCGIFINCTRRKL